MLGSMERWLNLKPMIVNYTVVSEKASEELVTELNSCIEDCEVTMQGMRVVRMNGKKKLIFSIDGTRHEQKQLAARLRQSPDLRVFETEKGFEREHE